MATPKLTDSLRIYHGGSVLEITLADLFATLAEGDVGTTDLVVTGNVTMGALPTANPAIAGQLWNDAGTVKVSAG